MIRKWNNQKVIPTPKTKVGKKQLNLQSGTDTKEYILSRMSKFFPECGHSVTWT